MENKQSGFTTAIIISRLRRVSLWLIIVATLIAVGAIGYWSYKTSQEWEKLGEGQAQVEISKNKLNEADEITNHSSREFPISAGVVPHHLLAKNLIEDFFAYIDSQGVPETIVILGPDHFQAGSISGNRLITLNPQREEFYGLKVDYFLIEALEKENNLVFSDSAIGLDHGITNLLGFIKKYFPESKIAPFIIPSDITLAQSEQFVTSLNSLTFPETLVIASVDFSHELPASAAEFHDAMSIRTLINFEKENFEKIEVDSPQALYIVRTFAHLREKESPHIIGYANSIDFLKNKSLDETTSYFSVVFKKEGLEESEKVEKFDGETILFVGDIMLARNVERLMQKNSIFYPFQKINQFLRGADIVFGNLEGPIVENPKEFSDDSLMFAFSQDTIRGLTFANLNLLSLANNHTLDMGKAGLEETREFLKEKGINSVGDQRICNGDFFHQKGNIKFFAFNKVYNPFCKDEEAIRAIKSSRTRDQDLFIIVSLHWGEEYFLTNSASQQKLAHQLIDAGADLIVGHHPHVVQNIEAYKGKLIFYSLGNFIFDQYFSKPTQEGLVVGLELGTVPVRGQPPKLVYRLFPIQIHLSQPFLMEQKESKEFLKDLAARSGSELSSQIKAGIIVYE